MPAVSEQEEFEFRLRAEREAAQRTLPPTAAPTAPAPQAPEKGAVQRGTEFTAGNLDIGLAQLLGLPVDTMVNIADLLKAGTGSLQRALGGKAEDMPELTDRSQVIGSGEHLTGLLQRMGIVTPEAEPQTAPGRVAAGALRAVPSVLAGRPGSMWQAVKGALGAGVSGGAAQTAAELGASPATQVLASTLPTLAGQAAALPKEGVRRAVVGDTDVAANIRKAREAGVTNPSAGMVTGNRMVAGAEGTLARLPGAGSIMDEAADRRATGMKTRTEELIDRLSPTGSVSAERAGSAVTAGVQGAVERFRANQRRLYARVDELVPGDRPIELTNYRRALRELAGPVRGAEASGKALVPGDVKGLYEALETDLAAVPVHEQPVEPNIPPRPKPPGEGATVRAKREYRDALARWRQNAAEAVQAAEARANAPETARSTVTGRAGPALERIDRDVPVTRPEQGREAKNSLPYDAVQGIRSKIGGKLDDLLLTDKAMYRRLYRALSDDVRASLDPQARQAWDRANRYTTAGHDRIDNVYQPLVDKQTPEKALKAAMSGTREGASSLRRIMGALTPDQRNAVAAHVIEEMGKAVPSAQGAEGARFEPQTFLTNWNKMSPEARKAMFSSPGMLKDMQTLADAAASMREAGRGTYNPAGTARAVTHAGFAGAGVTGVLLPLLAGHPGLAAATAGALASEVGLNYAAARAMTSPEFIHWLAEGTKLPTVNATSHLARLSVIAQNTRDPEIRASIEQLYGAFQAAVTEPQR